MTKHIKRLLWLVLLLMTVGVSAHACTLWSAAGKSVSGGGTIISKNRDRVPGAPQRIQVVRPKGGYAFVALIAGDEGEDQGFIAAGTNQHGLTVVSATASSIPSAKRKKMPQKSRLLSRLLASSKTVDEALSHKDWFYGPKFLLLSDRHETAVLEIGPDKKISISRSTDGVLYHTNYYVSDSLTSANLKIGESSSTRYKRIAALLKDAQYPLTVKQFQTFSLDHVAGPENSIMRTGGKPGQEKTIASYIVRTPESGSPIIYAVVRNQKEKEKSYELNVDDLLSGKATVKELP